MSLRKDYDKLKDDYNSLRFVIEDMAKSLPITPKNHTLKSKLQIAYDKVKKSFNKLDPQISDKVPEVKINTKDLSKLFLAKWEEYKDFMVEQNGIYMKSRMIKYRLKFLKELTKKDNGLAIKWLEQYMSSGSPNIYAVNELKIKTNTKDGQDTGSKKATFSLPESTK